MGVVQMDCRNWDEDIYRDAILHDRESLSRTVFRTAFAPNPNPNPNSDHIVTASSDGSIASYSISSCLKMGCGSARGSNWVVAEPHCLIQGHDGPAYDVKFYGSGDDSLLLSCGDDGRIRGWKWREILESEGPMQGYKLKPVLDLVNPQHKGPWGALSPIPENNAIAVDSQILLIFVMSGDQTNQILAAFGRGEPNESSEILGILILVYPVTSVLEVTSGSIYSATGDSCAYCWDMEKCEVKMVFKGHTNYLHCIVSCNSSNQIITGSEDGTARIWDCKSGKCIQVIDPEKDKKSKVSFPCISCIALDSSESWLACGKGQSISLWNLPARECVSKATTHSSVQDVLFDKNQILAVGAEPSLSRLNMNGDVLSLIQCAPQSVFSISLHPSGVTAVSGYGGLVDIISQFGSHSCTFRCKGF
ncbi:hypothetical protein BUALT_Bualt16G0048600 [Buddleja alternifolia]|uniref:THO complex subunit 6 n=1 Tax=Buddleja alternifolia TaxID=168488 RepID=A0AAV6WFE5_9LAMI|nr:hypothetical protein BUALT_Bualt16G0048600 [Buddleja alternifolia]